MLNWEQKSSRSSSTSSSSRERSRFDRNWRNHSTAKQTPVIGENQNLSPEVELGNLTGKGAEQNSGNTVGNGEAADGDFAAGLSTELLSINRRADEVLLTGIENHGSLDSAPKPSRPRFLKQSQKNDLLVGTIAMLPPKEVKNKNSFVDPKMEDGAWNHPVLVIGGKDSQRIYILIVSARPLKLLQNQD